MSAQRTLSMLTFNETRARCEGCSELVETMFRLEIVKDPPKRTRIRAITLCTACIEAFQILSKEREPARDVLCALCFGFMVQGPWTIGVTDPRGQRYATIRVCDECSRHATIHVSSVGYDQQMGPMLNFPPFPRTLPRKVRP